MGRPAGEGGTVIELLDNDTGASLGTISDAQLQFLVDQMEEESAADTDYYVSRDTLDVFEEQSADPALIALLRRALGEREGMEIRWERRG
jgi:processive 1,2-diacylglycerol beta-glucosyltransferase